MNRQLFESVRKLNGLTQYELAERLGVSRSLVAKIEINERAITTDLIAKMNRVFGVEHIEQVESVTASLV